MTRMTESTYDGMRQETGIPDLTGILSDDLRNKPASKREARQKGCPDYRGLLHMGLNENAFGMAPSAKKAAIDAAMKGNYYEDFMSRDLKKQIAETLHVNPEGIMTGAGSSPLIEYLGQAFLNPGDEVLMCRTFYAFVDMAQMRSAKEVIVPLTKDYRYNLPGMLSAVTEKTKMAVITNPNNPTGQYVSCDEIRNFIEALPKNIVVVVDEAYIQFATAPDCRTVLSLIDEFPDHPIIVLRTFSKYYGMAGLRAGFLVTQPAILDWLDAVSESETSLTAQAAAEAALKEQDYYRDCKRKIVEGIDYITRELTALGCDVFPTQTNFIMFDPHEDPQVIRQKLIERGILIATPMFCRVTVGTMDDNRAFIACMKDILKELRKAA